MDQQLKRVVGTVKCEKGMLKSIEESSLHKIAKPDSIAFYGASSRASTMGSIIMTSLLDSGFKGAIYPVHPTEKTIKGLLVYQNVEELPEVPDLVIIVLPTKIVCSTLEACGKMGIKQAIIISGGFKEVGGDGIKLEKQLISISQTYGIRVLGPNCLGITNTHHHLNSTPFPIEGSPGAIGLVSQSGSFVTQMLNYLSRLELGFSTAFSVGNEADLDMVDCMEYLAACPETKVIALYIEGIKRGEAFIKAAKSISTKKPIVAFYVGGSDSGRKAAFSHTGALSGPDQLYDGMFRQCGVIRAHSITQLFDYCWGLIEMPEPTGNRIVIQTHSGGPGASAADACGRADLDLPTLAEDTLEKLTAFLPQTASAANPVDLTFTRDIKQFLFEIPEVLLQDKNTDILLIYLLLPEETFKSRMMNDGFSEKEAEKKIVEMIDVGAPIFAALKEKYGKPVVGFTYRSLQEKMVHKMINLGIPVYQDPTRAVNAIRGVVDYYELKNGLEKE